MRGLFFSRRCNTVAAPEARRRRQVAGSPGLRPLGRGVKAAPGEHCGKHPWSRQRTSAHAARKPPPSPLTGIAEPFSTSHRMRRSACATATGRG